MRASLVRLFLFSSLALGCSEATTPAAPTGSESPAALTNGAFSAQVTEGRRIFRYDTFGDESFWGDKLHLHLAIAGAPNGGVGPGLSPRAALGLGLKVDVDALPRQLRADLRAGRVNLDDPAVTLALLGLNAVVGVTGFHDGAPGGRLGGVGIQCALCHSTVDDSLAPGIGHRLDGWPNRDLDVGQIVALAPNLTPYTTLLGVDDATVRTVLRAWGRGKFDAELLLDGKAFRPDGTTAATLLPAAFGLAGVNLHTYTGWGSITHWNAFVANLEMQGEGNFFDARLDDASRFPIAARNHLGHLHHDVDRISAKLGPLQIYQLTLPVPEAPDGTFDPAAAARGQLVFNGSARCAACHVPPTFSEPGWNLHTATEIGIDDFQASRSPDGRYRTTPLRGLFTRKTGGFYHDGRFATLAALVAHYESTFALGLNSEDRRDLIEYLKSL